MLHGIFEAQSEGRKNIDPYAWTFESGEATRFPAQVKVRTQQQCQPLTEDQFRPIIAENYYERSHFWFELDKAQTRQIIALFTKSTVPRNHRLSLHQGTRTIERGDTSLNTSSEGQELVCHVQKELAASSPVKPWISLFKGTVESKAIIKQEIASSSNRCNNESEVPNKTYPSKFNMDNCSDVETTVHDDPRHFYEAQSCEKDVNSGGMHVDFSQGSFESSVVSNDDNKAIHSENPSHQSNMEHNEAKALVSLSDGAVDLSSLTEEFILKMTLSDLRTFALNSYLVKCLTLLLARSSSFFTLAARASIVGSLSFCAGSSYFGLGQLVLFFRCWFIISYLEIKFRNVEFKTMSKYTNERI